MVGFPPPSQGGSQFCAGDFSFPCLWTAFSFSDVWNLMLKVCYKSMLWFPFPTHPFGISEPIVLICCPVNDRMMSVFAFCKSPAVSYQLCYPLITLWKPKAASYVKCVCLGTFHSPKLPCKSSWWCICTVKEKQYCLVLESLTWLKYSFLHTKSFESFLGIDSVILACLYLSLTNRNFV